MRILFLIALGVLLFPLSAFAQDGVVESGFMNMLGDTAPVWVVLMLVALRQIAEVIAKTIPDGTEGAMGMMRKIFKLIAIYVPNQK